MTDAQDVRWLSADEQKVWRNYLQATQLLAARLDQQMQADASIPMAYYEILVRLSENPDRTMRMSELSAASFQSRSRLSHAVARLEELGWVERQACPTDRRGALAVLTDEGFAALAAAAPGHVSQVRQDVFDQLTPELVKALGEISARIAGPLSGA